MKVIAFLSLILTSLLVSCKSVSHTESAYQNYRESQSSHLVQDGTIRYIDRGAGEVILLLHGVPSSGWLYRKMLDELVAQGYRVIVPDMLGFGNSSSPDGYEKYSAPEQAKRIISLMDALKIQQWNHVFHDVGGTWTWELMREHSHRVSKLVMLNSITLNEGFNPPIRMKPGFVAKTAMWAYRNDKRADFLLNSLFKEGLKDAHSISDEEKFGYKLPLLEGKTKGMYYFFTQTCNHSPDYSEVIEQVHSPTTVIWGKHDTMLQWHPQSSKVIQKLSIPPENIHLIDARHFIQEEEPELVNKLILQFLRK